jgi:hypothetical protein
MKKLPIGLQGFKEIVSKGYVYVDKTPWVADWFEKGMKLILRN